MESPHTNIPEGSNSTASSPPDPSTPPHDIYTSHPDVVHDRDYHHQQHSNLTPLQHHSLPHSAQSTPPKQQIQLPSLHSPSSPSFPFDSHPSSSYPSLGSHSNVLPMPLLDRPPPLERATPSEAEGFWPVQPSGPLTAPAGSLRRASFLDDLYEPQVNSASHQGSTHSTPVSGSPHPQSVGASFQQPHQAREPLVSLPRINRLSSFNPEWPPHSSASPAFSSSPSPPHISHHAHSNSLPVTSAGLSSSPSGNSYASPMVSSSSTYSYPSQLHSSEPPFYRRASFPIAQREENHSMSSLSSSSSYYNIPPPNQPTQSYRDYSNSAPQPNYPPSAQQQQQQQSYRPVLGSSASYTAEPLPISASPSALSHQTNGGHNGGVSGPQRHHSYSQGHSQHHHHPYASATSRFMHRSHSSNSLPPTNNQESNPWPSRPIHPSTATAAPPAPPPAAVVMHTDDAASKETAHLRRTCYNCRTTDPPSWRRSTLTPGKIVCNRCGLYERTHLRPRPSGIGGELRKAPSPRVPALTPAIPTSPNHQTTFGQSLSHIPPPPIQAPYLQHQYTHQNHESVSVKSESPVPMPISTGMLNHNGHGGAQYHHHHHHHHAESHHHMIPQSIEVGVGLGMGMKH